MLWGLIKSRKEVAEDTAYRLNKEYDEKLAEVKVKEDKLFTAARARRDEMLSKPCPINNGTPSCSAETCVHYYAGSYTESKLYIFEPCLGDLAVHSVDVKIWDARCKLWSQEK